ncbi:hypothetical protein M3Y99_00836900 [Aphelenchoides fujianensis]|nr:hypothetical protein M3Y99_00836900 [Aphelenchoides fujianensis]
MTPLDSRLIGFFYLVLSLFPLPFHLVVISAILRSKKNRNRPAHVITAARSVAEIGQLLLHAIGGICLLAGRAFCESAHLVLGHAMFFFWITMLFLHVLLCVNHFVVLAANQCIDKNNMAMTYVLIAVCYLGAAFCSASSSSNQMRFDVQKMSWTAARSERWDLAVFYLQIALVAVGLFCCSFVVLFLADQKRKVTQNRGAPKSSDVRMFVHSTAMFLLMATNFCLWFPVNFVLQDEILSAVLMNVLWILTAGLDIGRSIRELTIREPNTKNVSVVTN